MINQEKILIYKKYKGNIDLWARIGTLEEKKSMCDDDWYMIDSLVQDVIISRINLIQKLKTNTDSDEVRNEIMKIASSNEW